MTKRPDLPSPSAPNFNQRLRETLMTYLGRQGDPLDRGITLRDLVEAGIVKIKDGYVLRPGGETIPIEPDPGLGGGGTTPYEPDLTPPPTPTGFAVSAAISHIFIEHDPPAYAAGHGHLRTRVYGKVVQVGDPLPTFADAAEIAQFTGTVYAFPTNPATTWHLWIKWESVDGVLSVAPAGGTNGLVATTGQDVSDLLEALAGEITESQLFTDLATRIGLIDGEGPGSVNDRIAGSALTLTNAILGEASARVAADQALVTSFLGEASARALADQDLILAILAETDARVLSDAALAKVADLLTIASAEARASIVALQSSTATADSAQAATSLVMRASLGEAVAGLAVERAVRADGDSALASETQRIAAGVGANAAAIVVERQARVDADSASASVLTNLGTSFENNAAALLIEQTVRATADTAVSSQVTTLSAAVGDANSSLRVEQQARADADSATASQVSALVASFGTATSGILTEQQARATADAATASQLLVLNSSLGDAISSLRLEQETRSTQDLALTSQLLTLSAAFGAGQTAAQAAIQVEQQARADADSAAAGQVTTLGASIGSALAGLIVEQQVRATADTAVSQQVTSLTAGVGTALAGLSVEQTARTDADTAASSQLTTLSASFGAGQSATQAAVVVEQQARATADAATASQLTVLGSSVGASTAGLIAEQSVRATADSAISQQVVTVAAGVGAASSAVQVEQSARATADAASSQQVVTLSAALAANAAAIQTEQTARANADSASASSITVLQAGVGDNTAAIALEASVRAEETGDLFAQYTVKTDLAGFVSGYGLASTAPAGADPTSQFIVRADRFVVAPPSYTGSTAPAADAWGANSIQHFVRGRALLAVGGAGRVALAPSASGTWIFQTALRDGTWGAFDVVDAAWNGQVYVAVGSAGRCAVSSDGAAWEYNTSLATALSSLTAFGIAWNGATFVVVGSNARVATSPDGKVWTAQTGLSTVWGAVGTLDVLWDGTQFIAVGFSGRVATSPDGISWTNRSGLSSTGWSTTLIWRLMQHGSTVYALGADGKFAFSTDGAVTWTYTTNLRATTWGTANDIRGGAVAPAGTYLHDSGTVGAGATTTSIPLGKTVLLSTGSTYYLTMTLSGVSHRRQVSSTGSVSTLTVAEFPSAPAETTAWTLEVEGSPLILVVGENGACATSPNGTDWTYRATLAATSWATETGVSAVWDDGQFVIGSGAGKLATSPNGVTWTVQPAFGYASNLYGGFVWLDTSTTPPVTKYRSGDSWVTSPTALPLVVQSTPTVVDGQPIPAGVYMDAAFIRDATITRAKIANLAVDDAKIANLSVSKLTAGSIAVGEYIQSSGFVSGSAGFRIDGNGNAEFNDGTFRGTVYAAAGEIGGSVLGADFLRSTNFSAGSAGWRLKSDGTAEFGAAAIRGQLTADQIDTKGLTIKDAGGTTVFSASVPLAGAYIANAAITTAKIGDAQITTAKINDAAITSAKIGDAQVGTLKIGTNAVTVPGGATATTINSSAEGASVEVTLVAGQTVTIVASIGEYDSNQPQGTETRPIIRRGTTEVGKFHRPTQELTTEGSTTWFSHDQTVCLTDTGITADGTYTYKIVFPAMPTNGTSNTVRSSILVIQCKR